MRDPRDRGPLNEGLGLRTVHYLHPPAQAALSRSDAVREKVPGAVVRLRLPMLNFFKKKIGYFVQMGGP